MTDALPKRDPLPTVSVVIETITAREDDEGTPLVEALGPTLSALGRQTYPADRIEIVVVLDGDNAAEAVALGARFPEVVVARASRANYFAAKNAGAVQARGEVVAFVDADCVADPGWVEALVARLTPGVGGVTGRTRYAGRSAAARTFSVPDFGNVVEVGTGEASGIMLNNGAFRREVLLAHRLDERIRRNGGCYLLYHQLCAEGVRIAYAPDAVVAHGLDVAGLGFVRKHFDRGFDGTQVYRCDERGVLRGTRIVRRFGAIGLVGLVGRRILLDWSRLLRNRRQIGISLVTLPYFALVLMTTRLIELAGGLTAMARPGLYERPHGVAAA